MIEPLTGPWAGSVRWAVVPFAPKPPFRLYAGEGHPPIVVDDARSVITAARSGGDPELTYLVSAKARPVLVLGGPAEHAHREVSALRLLRLSKLSEDDQAHIRAQDDELLFYLAPERFDLVEECAVMVSALVRVHVEAIDAGAALGKLRDDEMRVLGERIVRFYGFDTRLLVERAIHELATRSRRRRVE